jgi:hypothetical protein
MPRIRFSPRCNTPDGLLKVREQQRRQARRCAASEGDLLVSVLQDGGVPSPVQRVTMRGLQNASHGTWRWGDEICPSTLRSENSEFEPF